MYQITMSIIGASIALGLPYLLIKGLDRFFPNLRG